MSVYMRAAERVITDAGVPETGGRYLCCCDAIFDTHNRDHDGLSHDEAFADAFKPDDAALFWWANPMRTLEDQQARVLALLFMHWMTVNPC